jgi:NADH-quinone oxidoreductase subunit C
MALSPAEITERIKSTFPEAVLGFDAESGSTQIAAPFMKEVALFLRDEPDLALDFLMCLSGVDYADGNLGAVYHLYSMTQKHKATLATKVPKADPRIPSVEKVWRTAEWHEREAYDLVGVVFEGHSDLRRILCPYDWEGHPLQKDYKQPEFYNGIKVPY